MTQRLLLVVLVVLASVEPSLVAPAFPDAGAYSPGTLVEEPESASTQTDATPPEIIIIVYPVPNAAGWNNTDVTVRFSCRDTESGVAVCPEPVSLTTETLGTTVSGLARDEVGNTATVSIVIKIDKTPPSSQLVGFDPDAVLTATTLALTGNVGDALAGIERVSCNGTLAVVNGAVATCTIDLFPGRNWIAFSATDVAGNSTSRTGAVTRIGLPTSLRVFPEALSLVPGQRRSLTVTDDFGMSVPGVSWTVDDPNVASISSADRSVLALAAGTTTIHATLGTLEAGITVTVSGSVVVGTPLWRVAPGTGKAFSSVIVTAATEISPPTTIVFSGNTARDTGGVYEEIQATAFSAAGEFLWAGQLPIEFGSVLEHAFADSLGGVVAVVWNWAGHATMLRLGPEGNLSWVRELKEFTYLSPGAFAQNDEGTIFYIRKFHNGIDDSTTIAGGINGVTGEELFRVLLPRSVRGSGTNCSTAIQYYYMYPARLSPITIGADGVARLLVGVGDELLPDLPTCEFYSIGDFNLSLFKITPAGLVTSQILDHVAGVDVVSFWGDDTFVPLGLLTTVHGEFVATWSRWLFDSYMIRQAYISEQSTTTYAAPGDRAPSLITGDNLAVVGGTNVTAYDPATGVVSWTTPLEGRPVATTSAGSVLVARKSVYEDQSDSLWTVSGSSATQFVSTPTDPWTRATIVPRADGDIIVGSSTTFGTLQHPELVQNAFFSEPGFSRRSAPSGKYRTLKAAAIAALREWFPQSFVMRVEFGANICKTKDDRYLIGALARATDALPSSLLLEPCPPSTNVRGDAHTHHECAPPPWSYDFSPGDFARIDLESPGHEAFVALPDRKIRKYLAGSGGQSTLLTERVLFTFRGEAVDQPCSIR